MAEDIVYEEDLLDELGKALRLTRLQDRQPNEFTYEEIEERFNDSHDTVRTRIVEMEKTGVVKRVDVLIDGKRTHVVRFLGGIE